MLKLSRCDRCGVAAFERFTRYGVCHECDYFEVKRKCPIRGPILGKCAALRLKEEVGRTQFTEEDYRIVRRTLFSIPNRERKIIFLHFWKNQKKEDIARRLGMTRNQVEEILFAAYMRLRELCLKNPKFSRSDGMAGAAA